MQNFDDKRIQMQLFWNPNSRTLDSCSQHGPATAWLMSEWMGNIILFQNHLHFTRTLSQYDAGSQCQIAKTVSEGRETMYTLLIFGFPGSRVILIHSSRTQWFGNKEKPVSIILVVQTSVGQTSMLAQLTSYERTACGELRIYLKMN